MPSKLLFEKKPAQDDFLGVTVQPMLKLDGYELIVGSSVDAQFGPVILFGSGGQLVEVYRDRALALPPLNTTLAARLMEQTRIFRAFQGVRGRAAVDMAALENVLVHFSRLVVEQPWIKEMDINPLLVSPERVIALDARIVLQDPGMPEELLPRPAIRPYPVQYVSPWTAKNGMQVLLRPIGPEDEPAMVRFHETLSDRSVYLRYFHMQKLSSRVASHGILPWQVRPLGRWAAAEPAIHSPPSTEKHTGRDKAGWRDAADVPPASPDPGARCGRRAR